MAKRFLVTGGTGFIGAALVKSLLKAGHFVRSFDNNSRGKISKLGEFAKDVELVEGDIRDLNSVMTAAKSIDSVIHLAYINGTEFFYSKPELVLDVAARGMMNVLDACEKNNIKDFVLASSSEVYQTPPQIPTDESVPLIVPDVKNPRYSYGGGKIFCELMTLHYGKKIFDRASIFRPHNVYGPDMGFEHVIPQFVMRMKKLSAKGGKFEIQGEGKQTRSFIFIDDFTDGLMKIVEKGKNGEIYHIGTQDEISIRELALRIAKLMNRDIDFAFVEEPKGSTQRRLPDTTKLKSLGFKPIHTLDEGLQKTIPWYEKQGDIK